MAFDLPTWLRARTAVLASGVSSYFQSNRFVRRTVRIEQPRLNLLELPEEILLKILRAVHDTPTPSSTRDGQEEWTLFDQATRDIQNVRLTCQLFNRISSEFLIRFVGVDVSVESLARLQGIMHHPTFGKGVSMVRIRLPVYESPLDLTLDKYAWEVRRNLIQFQYEMDPELRKLAEYYTDPGQRSPREERRFYAAIEPAHQEYGRRYQAQFEFLKRRFINGVANALAMSRRPLRIEITDRYDFMWSYRQSVYQATRENLLDVVSRPRPSSWVELDHRSLSRSRDYAWLIPPILAAFASDAIRIDDLHLDITESTAFYPATSAEPMSRGMRYAMRNLQRFTYLGGTHPSTFIFGPGWMPEWRTVLYNCLPPESLRDLVLRRVELEPSAQWRSLTRISLEEVRLDVKRLALLLDPLESHKVDIHLDRCYLSNGSWADVLDLLREKQRLARLDWPADLEMNTWVPCESISYLFSHLEDGHGGVSRAEQYIRGWLDINPVREHNGIDQPMLPPRP